jgi:hypothetical protein
MSSNLDAEVKRLTKLAKEHNVGENFLNEHVHDLASSLASDANNGGVEGQIWFLLTHWGVNDDDGLREVERIVTEKADLANS